MTSVILVIGQVNDAPNQVRYRRVLALAKLGKLHVVTIDPLPESLRSLVSKEYVVGRSAGLWWTCLRLASSLAQEGDVVVHTVWAPRPIIAGFLCKTLRGSTWVYDLYDHPSLTWSRETGWRRVLKQLAWLGLARMIRKADIWIIGMHPGILSYLPKPNSKCKIVLTGPGTVVAGSGVGAKSRKQEGELVICYAGPVTRERGMPLLAQWACSYEGPPARLHLMGKADKDGSHIINEVADIAATRGLRILQHGWIEHAQVQEILQNGDIGIFLVDPNVLNYRYAYPIKVLEYLSHGLIPVATDSYGVRAFIRDGENGFITEYEYHDFARTMNIAIDAVSNRVRKTEMGIRAVESIVDRHWDAVDDSLVSNLQSILSKMP